MHGPTDEQEKIILEEVKREEWFKEVFREYFPHVHLSRNVIPILKEYLRYAGGDKPLVLPRHLQYPDKPKNENEPEPTIEMEFDIPALLGDEPFFSLIKNMDYLDELKTIALRERFNIFKNIERKEEKLFFEYFQKFNIDNVTYSEDVPELFFKMLGNSIIAEYEPEKNHFVFDFENIFIHKPKDIVSAYRRFAKKVYNLRFFGICREIKNKDYKTLNKLFFEYLRNGIPDYTYYNKLCLRADAFTVRRTGYGLSEEEKQNINRLDTYCEMVNKELSGEIDGMDIHILTEPGIIIEKIKWCYSSDKKLDIENYKIDSNLPDGDKTSIGKGFNIVVKNLNPEFLSLNPGILSPKIEAILRSANAPEGKGDAYEKHWALSELLKDSESEGFLCLPEIKKVFTEDYKKKIDDINKHIFISSTDENVFDDEGNTVSLIETIDTSRSISGDKSSMTIEDKMIDDKILENIRTCIKNQFPEKLDEEFVDKLAVYLKKRFLALPPQAKERIQNNQWTDYALNKMFNIYIETKSLQKNSSLLDLIKEIFKIKMQKILRIYKENFNGMAGER